MRRWLALGGKHPRKAALLLGALAATGFEPLHLWGLALLALTGWIGLIARARDGRQAALIGWLFGVGHFSIGNNWIATAFTYQAAMPVWLGWIAVVALSLYLAVYPALAALGGWLIASRSPRPLIALPLALSASWIISEWLRSWVFTGFAWNPLGIMLLGGFDTPGVAGLTPWIGSYGLSGLTLLIAAAIRHLVILSPQVDQRRGRHLAAAAFGLGALLCAAMLLPDISPLRESKLPFTLVQPDIRQEALNDPALYEQQFVKTALLSLSRHPGEHRLVLWPESGVQDYLRNGYPARYYLDTYGGDPALARARIAQVIGPDALLLTGTTDLYIRNNRAYSGGNVVTAIDGRGTIRGSYAKSHLVPYGEYLPMRGLLEPLGLARLVPGDIDFLYGPGPRTLELGRWGRPGIQVCYEIIFSGRVADRANRPDFIFNPTNDGWFGAWGPPQHLAQARLRGIEEGLPVLRATTTGISAVIDANGVVRQFLPRNVSGRLEGKVPLPHAPTLFARAGNMLPLGWAIALLLLSLVASRQRRG